MGAELPLELVAGLRVWPQERWQDTLLMFFRPFSGTVSCAASTIAITDLTEDPPSEHSMKIPTRSSVPVNTQWKFLLVTVGNFMLGEFYLTIKIKNEILKMKYSVSSPRRNHPDDTIPYFSHSSHSNAHICFTIYYLHIAHVCFYLAWPYEPPVCPKANQLIRPLVAQMCLCREMVRRTLLARAPVPCPHLLLPPALNTFCSVKFFINTHINRVLDILPRTWGRIKPFLPNWNTHRITSKSKREIPRQTD